MFEFLSEYWALLGAAACATGWAVLAVRDVVRKWRRAPLPAEEGQAS